MAFLEQTLPWSQDLKASKDNSLTKMGTARNMLMVAGALVLLALSIWGAQSFFTSDMSQAQSGSAVVEVAQPERVTLSEQSLVTTEPIADASTFAAAVSQPSSMEAGDEGARESAANVSAEATSTSSTGTTTGVSLGAVAGVTGVDLLGTPEGSTVASFSAGTRLSVSGRSDDGNWLYLSTGGSAGWVDSAQVIAFDLAKIPVITVSDVPALVEVEESVAKTASTELESDTAMPQSEVTDEPATTAATDASNLLATITLDGTRLNIRSGPGTDYAIIDKAYPDEIYPVLSRNDSGEWIRIALSEAGDFGWVAAEYVSLNDLVSELPVSNSISLAPVYQEGLQPEQGSTVPQVSNDNMNQDSSSQPSVIATGDTGLEGTLVFAESKGGMIYTYELETAALQPLTYGFDPAISPDGRTVAFTRDGGENGLYLIDIDGDNERLIYSGRSGLGSPAWSPDGDWIVFSFRGDYHECWLLGRGMCLPDDPGSDDATLVREYSHNLAVVDVNGGNYLEPPTLNSAKASDWGEAGIVYQSDAGIQLTSDEPGVVNQLVAYDYLKPTYEDPALQPDGNLIVFQSREASHYEIFTMNTDGSSMQALTQPETTLVDELPSNVSPSWSPDGESIVFLSNRADDGSAGEWRIWVMDADGGNQRPLGVDVTIDYSFDAEQMVSWGI